MTELTIMKIAREALVTVIMVAGPVLVLSLLVGLIISIFQATTQIQEQTLTFVPKILTVLGATVLLGPWMLRIMIDFTNRLFNNMTQFIG
ncbi:MAG TPA: flagellar biosynthesis protein FliQ [Firmicutes bacterium]|nr:flagellar biosynthesis protein FliQ [Bacillota bacterium]